MFVTLIGQSLNNIRALSGIVHVDCDRVARWFVFKPKIQIWVNFGGPWNEKNGIFHGPLEYITAIWYILCLLSGNLVHFPSF
jgi:hypothetical protein